MDLTQDDYELIECAKDTARRLYVKDLHEVSAALRTRAGKVYSGIHIESSVGYADVCGEVAAMCNMISAGEHDIHTIVALWTDGEDNFWILSPCGRCRELISDLDPGAEVIVGSLDQPQKVSIEYLLPMKNK
jgi:cytidine deaminase